MRKIRWLVLPFVLLFALGCLCSQVQNIRNQVSTEMPGIMTGVSTAQGLIETMAAQTPSNCGTPTAGGLGVGLERAKTALEAIGQFTFTDGTVDGQPASIATLSESAASTYPAIAEGFSAKFIGDPCNLSKILITAPYTDQQETIDQGLAVANILFAAILPLDVQFSFMAWLAQNYGSVMASGQQQTTIKNMQFTLSRAQDVMTLEIVPAP